MKIHHPLGPPPVALLLNSTLPHILRVAAVAILNCWMASMCSNVRHARECMIARFHPSPLRKEIWWVDEKKKNGEKKMATKSEKTATLHFPQYPKIRLIDPHSFGDLYATHHEPQTAQLFDAHHQRRSTKKPLKRPMV